MLLSIAALVIGIAVLVLSADKFIEGASATAKYFGLSPLLIGMVIVGFGTSAPEILVSIMAAISGNSGLALGNALGSNIGNVGLILGISALVVPLTVRSNIIRNEMPLLLGVSILLGGLLYDGTLSRTDGLYLLGAFSVFLVWSILRGRERGDALDTEFAEELASATMSIQKAMIFLLGGLVVLIASSRVMVWGAVNVATYFGVTDLVIGLTIVAIGTSLPELASSLIAARKGEHDIAIGNVVGSNMFNCLVVTGIAASVKSIDVPPEVMTRDYPTMIGFNLLLFIFGFGFKGAGLINRFEGGIFLALYVGYTVYLLMTAV